MDTMLKGNKKKVLFICGSINQTSMMHQISMHMKDYEHYFTPYYADGFIRYLARQGYLDFSILGGSFRENTEKYLKNHGLKIDYMGTANDYDLAFTCSDLIVPENALDKKLILVQEGMTDPKNIGYYMVKWMRIPRYIAGTAATGLSDAYDLFCVASEGYKEMFIKNGVDESKLRVTGIPNYDNCARYYDNNFPHKGYVLVATSDSRETFKYENRKKFIEEAVEIANGRQLIFKLHPNEHVERATKEINTYAPGALVYSEGNAHEMIANCKVLITKYSTVVYTGLALNKEVYSYFDINDLKKLQPLQNGGNSARNIANIAIDYLEKDNRASNYEVEADNSRLIKTSTRVKKFISKFS